ncbi:MAG: hypothetical protein O3A47_13840 [Chloroflexi bacterium]|nr:hypothetical protein [Chloroflexota bacterium]
MTGARRLSIKVVSTGLLYGPIPGWPASFYADSSALASFMSLGRTMAITLLAGRAARRC